MHTSYERLFGKCQLFSRQAELITARNAALYYSGILCYFRVSIKVCYDWYESKVDDKVWDPAYCYSFIKDHSYSEFFVTYLSFY